MKKIIINIEATFNDDSSVDQLVDVRAKDEDIEIALSEIITVLHLTINNLKARYKDPFSNYKSDN